MPHQIDQLLQASFVAEGNSIAISRLWMHAIDKSRRDIAAGSLLFYQITRTLPGRRWSIADSCTTITLQESRGHQRANAIGPCSSIHTIMPGSSLGVGPTGSARSRKLLMSWSPTARAARQTANSPSGLSSVTLASK